MNNFTTGLILIAVGILLLLSNLGIIDNWREWWPLLLIAVGISILFQRKDSN